MVTRSLLSLAELLERRPRRLIALAVLPTIVLGALVFNVPVDLTFAGMLDSSQPQVAHYLEQSEALGFGGALIVLLRGRESMGAPERDAALDLGEERLQQALSDHAAVAAVVGPLDREWLLQQALWLMPRADFDRSVAGISEALAQGVSGGPLGFDAAFAEGGPAADLVTLWREALAEGSEASDRVIQVRLVEDPLVQPFSRNSYFELEPLIQQALAGVELDYDLSGLPAVAAQDQGRTISTVRRLSPISLLTVLVLIIMIERRWRVLFAVLAALLLAVAATLGAIGLLTGGLTLMETFFGVTVFGLGIDFAIHLLLRLRQERQKGRSPAVALERALGGTGRGVIAGAVTTAGAFLIVATAPDPVAVHLGLSGGIGLLFCLLLMLILVPAAWRREQVTSPASEADPLTPTSRPASRSAPRSTPVLVRMTWVPRSVALHAVRHPALHLGLALVVLTVAVLGMPRFRLESQIEKVFNRDVPAVRMVNEIRERFGVSGAPWVVPTASVAEAKELAERLRDLPLVASVASPSDVLVTDREEVERRRQMLDELHPDLHAAAAMLNTARGLLGQNDDIALLADMATTLDRAIEQGPVSESELPLGLQLQFRGVNALDRSSVHQTDSESVEPPWLVYAYAKESTFDAIKVRAVRQQVQLVAPEATGVSVLLEAVLIGPRPWLGRVGLSVVVFVVGVLLLDLRSVRWMFLAVLPVLLASAVTFGVMCWLPLNFNMMTVMVVPLLVGLGVDDGIHVVHRVRERRESLAAATGSVGGAILMTTATTCASFTILLFTNHPGLESMAVVMLVGLPLCLLASVSTLPAAATLLRFGSVGRAARLR